MPAGRARLPAGALVDRWSRRRVLVAANVASALVFGVLAVLVATGTASIVALVVGGFAAGVAETFVSPAVAASVRAVVPPEDRPVAYARMQGRHHVANLIGPPLGGALFAVAIGLPFAVDAVTFVAFACAIRFLRSKLPPPAQSERANVRRDVAEGLRFLWSQHGVRAIMIWGGVLNFAMVFVLVAVTLRLIRAGVHPGAIGAVDAIAAGAGILGAVAASRVAHLLPTGRTTLVTGLVLAAVGATTVTLLGAALVASAVVPLLLEPSVRRLGRPDQWTAATPEGVQS